MLSANQDTELREQIYQLIVSGRLTGQQIALDGLPFFPDAELPPQPEPEVSVSVTATFNRK